MVTYSDYCYRPLKDILFLCLAWPVRLRTGNSSAEETYTSRVNYRKTGTCRSKLTIVGVHPEDKGVTGSFIGCHQPCSRWVDSESPRPVASSAAVLKSFEVLSILFDTKHRDTVVAAIGTIKEATIPAYFDLSSHILTIETPWQGAHRFKLLNFSCFITVNGNTGVQLIQYINKRFIRMECGMSWSRPRCGYDCGWLIRNKARGLRLMLVNKQAVGTTITSDGKAAIRLESDRVRVGLVLKSGICIGSLNIVFNNGYRIGQVTRGFDLK